MKKKLVIFLICAFALASVGCTSGSGDTSGESQEAEKVVETAEDDKMTAEEEPAHEHTYVYTPLGDGTHKISCNECDEVDKTEPCSFDNDYVCKVCGFKHEHEFVNFVYDEEVGDAHTAKCTAEFCEESISEPCTLGEDGLCTVCGHQHEHTYEYYEKSENQYYKECKFEGCDFEEEAWKIRKLEWSISGGDASYHHSVDSYDYYVVRDVDVYDIPDLENGNIVGHLNKNDKVTITGATYYNDTGFDRTGEGYYIPQLGYNSTIALCRTDQAIVLKSVGAGIYYNDPTNIVAVYGSKDEAYIAMTGHDRAYIKANGTYQAPPFAGSDSSYICYDGGTKIQMGEFDNNANLWVNDQPYIVYQPSSD